VIYSAFHHKHLALRESLNLFLESLRPNAAQRFQTLAQSLFERPTLDEENQIAYAFRQPVKEIRSLLAENRLHNLRFEQRRNTVERAALVQRYCEGFKIPQREDYLDLIRKDERSRIFTSFHCGDFLYGSASLFNLDSSKRKKFVLSLNRNSSACYSNLSAGFSNTALGPKCELLLTETGTSKLSQILRAGNSSILLFCDLPPGLNETTEVNFLNRQAWFSIGPAILALVNRVPLLPFINYSTGNSSYLKLGNQIEPILLPSETLQMGAKRITQSLVSFFEAVFLESPEQWRFLSFLPGYFSKPSSGEVSRCQKLVE
tara:strand:+ start:23951 stop:24901 length:951 start_codon:yes stop_codon:yes gene_type:complete